MSAEASSLAGHLGLGALNLIYDDNRISIEGHTELSFSEDVAARYESYGWHVQRVGLAADGDVDAAARAFAAGLDMEPGVAERLDGRFHLLDHRALQAVQEAAELGSGRAAGFVLARVPVRLEVREVRRRQREGRGEE